MIRALTFALILGGLIIASRIVLPVRKVEVIGAQHLSVAQLEAMTGLHPGIPWLWVGSWNLNTLRANPWIARAELSRPRLGLVVLKVSERHPIATLQLGQQSWGLAPDGTLLPGAPPTGPRIQGWGPLPLHRLLRILKLLPQAQKIRFDPSGFRISLGNETIWLGHVRELQSWLKTATISGSASVYLYPWGESVR
jgi:hypothetical protein